jgi:F-type H+-transporting ATPase subunit delta
VPGAGSSSRTAHTIGGELFTVVHLLDREHGLRRALSDPAKSADNKAAVLMALLTGRVAAATADIAAAAVKLRWSGPRDLCDGLAELAVTAIVIDADAEGRLDDLEDEIFRFGRVVAAAPDLRAALGDPRLPADRKRDLLAALLDGKVTRAALSLITEAAQQPRGHSLETNLEEYGRLAAQWRERLVAVVRTATALSDAQRGRLVAALAAMYGHQVHLAVVADPGVLGGLSVEVRGEIIDGTVVSRLQAVRRRLAS